MNIGKLISEFRTANNLTQTAFGNKIGVSKQTVSKWENNKIQPNIKQLYEIAQVIAVPVDDLINDSLGEGNPFIFAHRSQYDVGLNSVYHCIHDFKSLCVFINLLNSAFHLLEPESNVFGFLFNHITNDAIVPDSDLIPVKSVFFDGEYIAIEIPNTTLGLKEESVSRIEKIGLFNNETYAINIYLTSGYIQLFLGFHNDVGE